MSEPMMAQIMAFGGNYVPKDWKFCNGELLDIQSAQALYSLLGTYYGGDGRTTVGLPDLRGRTTVGYGDGPGRTFRDFGQSGGQEAVRFTVGQMPEHTHTFSDTEVSGQVACLLMALDTEGDESGASEAMLANQGSKISSGTKIYSKKNAQTVSLSGGAIATTHNLNLSGGQTDPTGGDGYHENMPPWICINYIIALDGYYPLRS